MTLFNGINWKPPQGYKLVTTNQHDTFKLIDSNRNICIYTVTLLPCNNREHTGKPSIEVQVELSTHPQCHDAIKQFPHGLFFTHLLSCYTIVLTGNGYVTDTLRFWFRRCIWALSQGYCITLCNKSKRDNTIGVLNDYTTFFNAWLTFCHYKLAGKKAGQYMTIKTGGRQ